MPSMPVSLGIDIDGTATIKEYSVSGTIEETYNGVLTSTPYGWSGVPGETVTLFTEIIAAPANTYIIPTPSGLLSTNNAYLDNYTVEHSVIRDGENRITTASWTVKYTFPSEDVTGDQFIVKADTDDILVVTPGAEKYYSYKFQGITSIINEEYYLDYSAQSYILQVFGDVGAEVDITYTVNGGGATVIPTYTIVNATAGYVKIPIDFPIVATPTVYEFTLSGDIDPGFVQPNPIVVYTSADTVVDLDATPLTGYTITRSGIYTVSGNEGYVDRADQVNTRLQATFKITADNGSDIKLQNIPTWADITNTNSGTNGGTIFDYSPSLNITGDGTEEVTVEVIGWVTKFGNTDVSSVLTLSALINSAPVAVDDYFAVLKGKTIFLDVAANDTNGATAASSVETSPTYGTASVSGDDVEYTHDNSTNFADSFTYKSTDGFESSANDGTVYIDIGIKSTVPFMVAGGEGIHDITTSIGVDGAVLGFHFDAGSIPARMEVYYDGVLQADTLFVGDDLTDAGRATAISNITGTSALNSFQYVGGFGDGLTYGSTAAWNLITAGNIVSYADPADIAANGGDRSVTENVGNQVGIVDNTFMSKVDVVGTTGLETADGNVAVTVPIAPGTPHTVTIRITGISGSSWELYQVTQDLWIA